MVENPEKISPDKLEAFRKMLLPAGQRIVVVSHTNPDGDAIGAALACRRLLTGMGHEVCAVVPNYFPSFLAWMPDIEQLQIAKGDSDGKIVAAIQAADIIICVDFNQIERLEQLGEAIAANTHARRVLIDHHPGSPVGYDLAFSSPASSSTSYLIFKIIEAIAGSDAVDAAMAELLYVGMMTDTGNFSFGNLTPELFRAVAVLLEKGIDIPAINAQVYNDFSEGRMRLLGYALSQKMEVMKSYGAAFICLKENELRRFNFQIGDSEGFVNYPLSIREIKMSAMFLQTRHFIRVSLRSRGEVDVNLFARRYFAGGGHRNASGGKSFTTMEETADRFRAAVAEFMKSEP